MLGERKATFFDLVSPRPLSNGATWEDSVKNYFKAKREQLKDGGLALSDISRI